MNGIPDSVILWIFGTLIAVVTTSQFAVWGAIWALYRQNSAILVTLSKDYHTKPEIKDVVTQALIPVKLSQDHVLKRLDLLVSIFIKSGKDPVALLETN